MEISASFLFAHILLCFYFAVLFTIEGSSSISSTSACCLPCFCWIKLWGVNKHLNWGVFIFATCSMIIPFFLKHSLHFRTTFIDCQIVHDLVVRVATCGAREPGLIPATSKCFSLIRFISRYVKNWEPAALKIVQCQSTLHATSLAFCTRHVWAHKKRHPLKSKIISIGMSVKSVTYHNIQLKMPLNTFISEHLLWINTQIKGDADCNDLYCSILKVPIKPTPIYRNN